MIRERREKSREERREIQEERRDLTMREGEREREKETERKPGDRIARVTWCARCVRRRKHSLCGGLS